MERLVDETTLSGVRNAELALTGDEAAAEKAEAEAKLADKMAMIEEDMR